MSKGILAEREKALEDLFFEKQNQKLLDKLRAEREDSEARQGLAEITGIKEAKLLDKLVDLDLSAQTWAALSLVPLVEVAWANGTVEDKERQAVLTAAEANGVLRGGASFELLEQWLAARPSAGYLEAWGACMVVLCAQLDPAQRASMKREVQARALRVAQAAGGFLGLGNKVSSAEQRVIDEVGKAFD